MKRLILTFTLIQSFLIFSQDSVSVLFIGNSYTYANNLPVMVEDLATSLGDVVYQSSHTQGGATLSTHAGNAATYTAIQSEPWDFVVLQAQSQEPSFPDNQVDAQTLPYAEQLADSVYANRFCSDVMMFMTWGRENGDPQWAPISTYDGMQERLRSAYMRMADSVQGSVSAVGSAWKYVRDNYPMINLYTTDGSHPNVAGSYLAACTFYASLFRKTPVGSTYYSSLDANTAGILQNAAALTVLDSLDHWNLRPISEHTQANFDYTIIGGTVDFGNLSTKATDYVWDFGDLNSSTDEHPSNTYTMSGTYTVSLIANSPCDSDTMEIDITISLAGIAETNNEWMLMSLEKGVYELKINSAPQVYVIRDIMGRVVGYGRTDERIDISQESSGIYILNFTTDKGQVTIKILN
jgi:hypothetical protein